ncbi:putative bifunctional diguanylate cyclase/phosphodiesterase [Roseateles saccharophilus]|uniref:PAS domain S-box-containing protein/diguanylate cyclase (GGDEF)-like protein n=1 Tax=Roseateles saccharophilus TaxID=304 RepID=A0A4V2VS66_ROSSA|nr:EAL domain-containing protein [Roseateles saccharophilus]MDG0831769.1 EAL domain-containing protein [Roseateles saccharophilus]TCV01210.1 PAS domain S-box-containing protein/diguanylate cyclase (GGDEF)-like protein [Roseateles saccharophilus]
MTAPTVIDLERQALDAARFRMLADHVPAWIALYGASDHRCLFANRGYAEAFHLTQDSIVGMHFSDIVGAEAYAQVRGSVDLLVRELRPVVYERELVHPNGEPTCLEVHLIPQFDAEGVLLGSWVLVYDITRHRLAERRLRESEGRLDKFMQASVEGILFHRDGIMTDVNQPLCAMTGWSAAELIGQHVLAYVAEDELPKVREVMRQGQELRYETVIRHRDGSRVPVELIMRTMERDGERLRMAVVRDIRDRLASEARIQHLAHHDALTGLLNRAAFMDRMALLMRHAERKGETLALLFIDLDNFKRVNDSLGHLEGDQVLTTVSERLVSALRASDLVGRFGGDEFVVLLTDLNSRADIKVVLDALLSVVEVPVKADGRALSVTPSIGVAVYPDDGRQADELIQHADTAMYRAKARGRATYQFFESVLAETAYADLVLEAELAQGLTRNEFELFFQPQVEATTGQLSGAEALLRWRHPQRGLLGPDAFIFVAERHRLMLALGEWVLREAAATARRWREQKLTHGHGPMRIAVNLSRMQFHLDGFADTVRRVLDDSGAQGQWLELELTERMLMDHIEHAPATLAQLRALGLTVSVDDFGTGYTSLAHLTELPLDKLKIDQSFVARLPDDVGAQAITRAIVQMAVGLGLTVTAEGVRSAAQWQLLAGWGCQQFQGELVGAPMSAPDFEAWVKAR